ncbi:MAG: hypothetical protein R2828_19325 [Saprospiraceae bacterium]
MEKLKELVDLVTRNKIKSVDMIGGLSDTDTKLGQFYESLKNGEIHSDEEAFELLYTGEEHEKNAYYKLKHTLRERLLNTLYFTDLKHSTYSEIRKAKLSLQKLIHTHNLLYNKGALVNAIDLAEKSLTTALFYEFTEEAYYLARRLRAHYASHCGQREKFQYYHTITQQQQEFLEAESLGQGYKNDLVTLYIADKSTKDFVYHVVNGYLDNLQRKALPGITCNYYYYLSFLKVAKHMSINDYAMAGRVCKEAIETLNSYRFLNYKWILLLSLQYIACCIQTKNYEEGKATILYCQTLFFKTTYNWFKINELYFMLCTHTKNYDKALEIFEETVGNQHFAAQPKSLREPWKIYEAWLYFLTKSSAITTADSSKNTELDFRINKYLNEVPIFSKDKRGLNIPILISQIMLLLLQKKYDVILDKIEAIAKYKDRYIRKEDNFRSNMFIRMLLEIPNGYFKRTQVAQRAGKYKLQLEAMPLDIANQSRDLEIVPYEDAWELLLLQLEQK